MPLISFGDPRFQIDMLLGFLDDIDNLENSRSKEITETYEKWSAENEKVKAENEEYYDWKVDSFYIRILLEKSSDLVQKIHVDRILPT